MADPKGFMTTPRETPKRRPVDVRILDWKEVYEPQSFEHLQKQAGRCMDCGIPFCHSGCPLGNLIPEWNDLIYRGDKVEAIDRLHATNNFPEFTSQSSQVASVLRHAKLHVLLESIVMLSLLSRLNFALLKKLSMPTM